MPCPPNSILPGRSTPVGPGSRHLETALSIMASPAESCFTACCARRRGRGRPASVECPFEAPFDAVISPCGRRTKDLIRSSRACELRGHSRQQVDSRKSAPPPAAHGHVTLMMPKVDYEANQPARARPPASLAHDPRPGCRAGCRSGRAACGGVPAAAAASEDRRDVPGRSGWVRWGRG